MTMPPPPVPPHGPQPARGPRHSREPEPSRGITRIVPTSDLPDGVGALASADGSTVYVSASLSKTARRAALREVLRATHRFPSLVLIPALVNARVRRFFAQLLESSSDLAQHAANLATASPMATTAVSAVAVAVIAAGTAGVIVAAAPPARQGSVSTPAGRNQPYPVPTTAPAHPVVITLPTYPDSYLGVYAKGVPSSYGSVDSFAHTAGVQPDLALYYSGWGEPFNASFGVAAADNDAVPLIQIDPRNADIGAIAAGNYDHFLDMFADAVAEYGLQTGQAVVIGFGHEMNASWYPWGAGHLAPGLFVAAWQHIVDVFRSHNADNVTWLWTINQVTSVPIQDYWPGGSYVTWVGIDAYYRQPGDTFSSVFGPSIAAVRQVTGDPILLSETAAPVGSAQAGQIGSLFKGILGRQILGFVWFDADSREDWRLEDSTAAAAAFRKAARGYQ
jgi:hypothetical protein